jgi:ATP phosphoribosyltransferase regulatory subunit HisZ
MLCQNKLKIFQVDFKNFELNEEKINIITNCLKNWDLNHFHIDLSNVKINDSQLENLFYPLRNMKNLKKLHLVFENMDMNEKRRTYIQNFIKELPNLISVRLNIKNNKLTKDEIDSFRQLLNSYQDNELLHD